MFKKLANPYRIHITKMSLKSMESQEGVMAFILSFPELEELRQTHKFLNSKAMST